MVTPSSNRLRGCPAQDASVVPAWAWPQ